MKTLASAVAPEAASPKSSEGIRSEGHAQETRPYSAVETTNTRVNDYIKSGTSLEHVDKRLNDELQDPEVQRQFESMLRREKLDQALSRETDPEARLKLLSDYAIKGEYFSSQNPGHIGKFKGFVNELGLIPGVEGALKRIGGQNSNVGRGEYCSLARAAHMKWAGKDILAIGTWVGIPGAGRTDIDILCRGKDGRLEWHENKHVRNIFSDAKFCTKIDKMSEAMAQGFEVLVEGKMGKIDRFVFTNSGSISEFAKEYAQGKGIEIYDHKKYTKPV